VCVSRASSGRLQAVLRGVCVALLALTVQFVTACQTTEQVVVQGTPGRPVADDGKNRPFGWFSRLADPSGPSAEVGRAYYGTGEFTSGPDKYVLRDLPDGGDGARTHSLNLVEVSVTEAAAAVLGDVYGVNYTVDPKIDSRITIQTSRPVNRAGIGELFEASLRTIGAAIVRNGNVYRVVTADQAAMGARIGRERGESVGNGVRVAQLRFVSAAEMKRILEPLAPFGGVVRIDPSRNALVLSGTEQEIAAMEDTISVFDVNHMRGMSFATVPMRGVEPEAIVGDLIKVFGTDAEGPMNGMVQFIPNNRLRSMLIVSRQPEYIPEAQRWVRRLDEQGAGEQRLFHSYSLRNRQAGELVQVLNAMFATESGPEDAPEQAAGRTMGSSPDGTTPALPASASGGAVAGGDMFSNAFAPPQSRGAEAFGAFPVGASAGPPDGGSTGFGAGARGQPRIKIVADPAQNALLILASVPDYRRVEQVIRSLDVIPNQVLIEATIAEVTLNDDMRFGLRWFLQNKAGNRSVALSELINGAVGSAFPGFSFVAKVAGGQVTLNALNEIGRVNVLASPSLMVVDRKTATLQIGDQVPITTQTAQSVLTPGAPIVNSIAYRDTGVVLNITPRINESGRVLLDIEQEVSSVQQTTSSRIDSPTFGRRRVKTTVVVSNGEGITLGGLIQDRSAQVDTQVPVLGDIPIFGNAFKDKQNLVEKTELVIILTPRVVRDLNEAHAVTEEYRRKIDAFAPPPRQPGRNILHNVKRVVE
jgi:general secretion pathway protein D